MIRLTDDEIRFFRDNGYLIKRGVLDPDLMSEARDSLWANAPDSRRRDDPDTWIGAWKPEDESDDPKSLRKGTRWNFRLLGGEEFMVNLLPADPNVHGMAEQLLGEGTIPVPTRMRGIYCTFPYGDVEKKGYGCHVDAHPFHLGVVGYIDDVPPEGGGFCVWAGSHKTFYQDFHSQYKMEPKDCHEEHRRQVNDSPHTDCYGSAGDIVFWHHRIGHMAGHNYSRQIRQAVLCDYRKRDLDTTQDEPPQDDMWRDWDGIRSLNERDNG
ncbi:MAG: phytanoyl-CoA dioxygenase family protein [Candidatus Poribacteria bacterium]|nr:phytanoyl-CoA dioxygenase family protein [Candidatus Poribacteria bacterium]